MAMATTMAEETIMVTKAMESHRYFIVVIPSFVYITHIKISKTRYFTFVSVYSFNLDQQEANNEQKIALNAMRVSFLLWENNNVLTSKSKHDISLKESSPSNVANSRAPYLKINRLIKETKEFHHVCCPFL
jgi:hypothetical protein